MSVRKGTVFNRCEGLSRVISKASLVRFVNVCDLRSFLYSEPFVES